MKTHPEFCTVRNYVEYKFIIYHRTCIKWCQENVTIVTNFIIYEHITQISVASQNNNSIITLSINHHKSDS